MLYSEETEAESILNSSKPATGSCSVFVPHSQSVCLDKKSHMKWFFYFYFDE